MNDGFFGLTDLYLKMFREKGEECFGFMTGSSVARKVWLSKYRKMEKMEKDERRQLFEYVSNRFPEKTVRQKIEAVRIIYAIGITI